MKITHVFFGTGKLTTFPVSWNDELPVYCLIIPRKVRKRNSLDRLYFHYTRICCGVLLNLIYVTYGFAPKHKKCFNSLNNRCDKMLKLIKAWGLNSFFELRFFGGY